ncbi:hypothetical protein ACVJBD_004830 [Rhizobium mongolense]
MHFGCETLEGEGNLLSSACKRAHLPGMRSEASTRRRCGPRMSLAAVSVSTTSKAGAFVYTKCEEIVVVSDGCDADQIAGGGTSKCQSGAAMSLDHQYVAGINHAVFFGQLE